MTNIISFKIINKAVRKTKTLLSNYLNISLDRRDFGRINTSGCFIRFIEARGNNAQSSFQTRR